MAKGIIYVETRPSSPDRDQEYNTWYDEVHIPELVALDGIVSARRLRPVDGDGPYVALYELEGDNLRAILDNMRGQLPAAAHVRCPAVGSAAGDAPPRSDNRLPADGLNAHATRA